MIRPWISKGSISTEKEPTPLPYNGATAVAFEMLISFWIKKELNGITNTLDTLAIFILSKDVYWDCNSITREGEQIVHRTSYDYGSSRSGCDCQVVYHWRIERDRIVIQYFVVIHFFNKDVTREILSYNPIETQRNWCSWAIVTS